ncbi:MAG TPA: hypothetical protein VES39_07845, partial [Rhodospirillales bacterium]|nr:hypothetical protein [Rhodospirillales bacterium]
MAKLLSENRPQKRAPRRSTVWPFAGIALAILTQFAQAGQFSNGTLPLVLATPEAAGTPAPQLVPHSRKPLMLPADIVAKDAANAAADTAARTEGPFAPRAEAPPRPDAAPGIVGGRSFAGQFDAGVTPPDSTGAIGTTRFVQLANTRFAIYSRTSNTPLQAGPLAALGGLAAGSSVADPQIIWDATTNRFYYVFLFLRDPIFFSDNLLAVGFSKTASPNTAADWCKYLIPFGNQLPDYPKLGDSAGLVIIGANTFDGATGSYVSSDVMAITKPPAGSTCPAQESFETRVEEGLRTPGGGLVFTPVPANQIDGATDGYVIARSGTLPSNRLWMFRVTRAADGEPVIDDVGKPVVLSASYGVPADASQGGASQRLDTLDARNTQAILSRNPLRANRFSLWTQHTVASGTVSAVRWYEIDPLGTPVVRRTGSIAAASRFLYNAAISSDRRVDGATSAFGGSFVVGYNESGAAEGIQPRIVMRSSLNGAAVSAPVLVRGAVGPYRDFSCITPGSVCRWGD